MEVDNICRLCLATDDLIYIFDDENKELKMKDVVSITTGIEIHSKDIISKKVCGKCYQFSIQIFQFRSQCLKSDKYLKDLCMDYLVDKKYYIPNTEVSIKGIVKSEEIPKIKPVFTNIPPVYKIHPSIITLLNTNPEIKLPNICLSLDVAPIVQIEMNQVENYFKRFKLDIKFHVKNILVSTKNLEKPTRFNRIKKLSKQKKMLTLPKGIKITKIRKSNKTNKKRDRETATFTETIKNTEEICRTPNKNPVRRKRIESPQKARVGKPHSKAAHCETNTTSITPKRKRKLVTTEKSPQEKDPSKNTLPNQTDVLRSPTRRRRKLLLAENCSNQQTVDVGAVANKPTPGKAQSNKKLSEKQCALNDKQVEESIKTADNTGMLESPKKKPLNENDEYEPLACVGRSVPLFVCEICNSVHYNLHDLKKHQNKHMRCQFCKVRFRSLENKKYHIENVCPIKKMMNDLPHVNLERIECNETIRESYSEAFVGFVDVIERKADSNNISDEEAVFRGFPPQTLDSIDLSSEGDTLPYLLYHKEPPPPIVPDVSVNVLSSSFQASKNEVLKHLSTIISKEAGVQTDLPTNHDISVTGNNEAILKGLLAYVFPYNIPVKIQLGQFNVTYTDTFKSKSTKKLCLWNDLTPITIESRAEDAIEVTKP